jgi:hypothetical protein
MISIGNSFTPGRHSPLGHALNSHTQPWCRSVQVSWHPYEEIPIVVSPDRRAVRELAYDIPRRGVEKYIRDILGLAPALIIIVCVDEAGVIVAEGFERID